MKSATPPQRPAETRGILKVKITMPLPGGSPGSGIEALFIRSCTNRWRYADRREKFFVWLRQKLLKSCRHTLPVFPAIRQDSATGASSACCRIIVHDPSMGSLHDMDSCVKPASSGGKISHPWSYFHFSNSAYFKGTSMSSLRSSTVIVEISSSEGFSSPATRSAWAATILSKRLRTSRALPKFPSRSS